MSHIFDVLHEDHDRVANLLAQIELTETEEIEEREALVEIVRAELKTHASFEEQEVYPAIQRALGSKQPLQHAVEEHEEAMRLLVKLEDSMKSNNGWKTCVEELKTAIEHHVDEEENELFPEARAVLPEGDAENLAREYQARREDMPV